MAKVFNPPKEFKVPEIDFLNFNRKDYENQIKEYKDRLSKFLKDKSPNEKYIGEIINFPIADGIAEYMVATLKPLQLIHLPIGDAYNSPNVDLMTKKRVIEMIESKKILDELFSIKEPKKYEIQEVINTHCIDVSTISEIEFNKLHDRSRKYQKSHLLIKWENVEYLIPKYSTKHNYDHNTYKYLCNKFKG